ncbi:transcriptional regulator [Pseudomonas sp. GM33]|jgi:DNA-binding transcriptional LysR family regulator|uniref:LysR family transcriptional regulator n=1 Tax=Pseudomonas TaxID=286 RepID=UPI000270451D|nr:MULTISPECIES: LysR family transcriptional regulator [Pseudomonas]EJM37630.1 transcriptional regulator [Pseudomonas sp. GM33]PVZ53949.1 LysR family transcriptional regulator [Pseudomonas sp. B1(2018)]UVM07520.1 LysR family transcriptional regulator [Pseudomonas laurylsulfatiphila]
MYWQKSPMDMQKRTTQPPLNWDDLRFFLEVARARTASGAARRLGVDYTTVSRRIRALEQCLGALLFEKSRTSGFVLTVEGQRLVGHAESLESTLLVACEQVFGTTGGLSGHLRIGCTEAFGTCFITAQMSHFLEHYPNISADILPVPHFINLSRREADIAITLERPERGPYVCSRLCDYRLRLYATPEYLANHPSIGCREDLSSHPFVTYVEDLAFSFKLLYLNDLMPGANCRLRSTSVVAHYHAALEGRALAILPCFLAGPDPRLCEVLPGEVEVTRQFWMYYSEDLRKLKRVTLVADYLRACAELNRPLLMGESHTMHYLPSP